MTEYIGGIPVSSIQNVTITNSENSDEINLIDKQDNFILEDTEEGQEIDIEFTLLKQSHPQNLSIEEQKDDIFSLNSSSLKNNKFEYKGYTYYLSIQDISLTEDSQVRNLYRGTISTIALSWPKSRSFIEDISEGYGSGIYGNGPYSGRSSYGSGKI